MRCTVCRKSRCQHVGVSGTTDRSRTICPFPSHSLFAVLQGGLGLTSAVRGCWAAHWASWTDCFAMINKRPPEVGRIILENLSRESVPCLTSFKRIDGQLRRHMELPTWEEFVEGTQPQENESVEPGLSRHGWQKTVHLCFILRRGCGPFSITLTEPCRDPNEGPSLQHPLCPCLQTDFQSSTRSRSGCSSDAAFVFPFLCL